MAFTKKKKSNATTAGLLGVAVGAGIAAAVKLLSSKKTQANVKNTVSRAKKSLETALKGEKKVIKKAVKKAVAKKSSKAKK